MIRALRSLSCSRVLQFRSILNGPEILTVKKFRSIQSFVNYQSNATTNFQEFCLQSQRPFRKTFEVNLLPILKTPHQLTTYMEKKNFDFRHQSPKNFLRCRQIKEAVALNCSQNSPADSVYLSAKTDSRRPVNCPPCEPCPIKSAVQPPPPASENPSKEGRLVGGLFTLVIKFVIAVGVVQFSDAIGVWDNPTSWELMQIKWKQFAKDVEGIVIDNYHNREK